MKDLDVKKIQPNKGYVLVEPAKAEEKTKSGIILSESDSEKPQHGVVLAVGESGCCCDDDCCKSEDCCESEGCCGGNCDCEASPVKVGDKVIYKKWGGNEFKVGETEYQFLKFEDILAIITD